MRELLFTSFGIFSIAMAVGVVFSRNAVYSAFCLLLSFFGLAAIYLLWDATFVAVLQILIYTGAIVVLFVFVIMLLQLSEIPPPFSGKGPAVLLVGITAWQFVLLWLRTLNKSDLYISNTGSAPADLKLVATTLFTEYLWAFEILSVFLLAVIIAVCVLVRPQPKEIAQ